MNKELKDLIKKANKREGQMVQKAMSNLELITEAIEINKIQNAIKRWNLVAYGNEETEFIHTNLYQDKTDKNRILFEKPGISMDIFRIVYVFEEERIVDQKESYQKGKYTTDNKWEVIISSI